MLFRFYSRFHCLLLARVPKTFFVSSHFRYVFVHMSVFACSFSVSRSFFFFFQFIQLKSADCEANGINHSNDNLISNAEITSIQCDDGAGGGGHGQMNHHSGANGSLITMTMKNNHLIVETEERSVSIAQLEHSSSARQPFIFIFSAIDFDVRSYIFSQIKDATINDCCEIGYNFSTPSAPHSSFSKSELCHRHTWTGEKKNPKPITIFHTIFLHNVAPNIRVKIQRIINSFEMITGEKCKFERKILCTIFYERKFYERIFFFAEKRIERTPRERRKHWICTQVEQMRQITLARTFLCPGMNCAWGIRSSWMK